MIRNLENIGFQIVSQYEKELKKVIPKVKIQRENIRGILYPNKKAVNITYFVTNVRFVKSR